MKKRTKGFLLIFFLLVICGIYLSHNFQEDRATATAVLRLASNGKVQMTLTALDTIDRFSNPLINYKFREFKRGYIERFTTETEIIENNFSSEIVYDIANIYRKYWRTQVLKKDPTEKSDTLLYNELSDYLVSSKLTALPMESLRREIKNDKVLSEILAEEGFKFKFMFRNGFQDLLLWENESNEKNNIILPDSTVEINIIQVEEILLSGFSGYISFEKDKVGGWAIKESPTIYCLDEWQRGAESYEISFLKHEALHHLDLNKYPNLSSADLEYRSKLVEMMYCTQNTIYNRIGEWLNSASDEDRSYSHPFANHCIIRDFSRLIFQQEYQNDYSAWQKIDVDVINETATILYEANKKVLTLNPAASEVLQL